MKSIEAEEFSKFIHSVRNPLNSISLHAELGKMLIENHASTEEIKNAFMIILQQCRCCEQVIGDMRKNNDDESSN